MGSPDLIKEEKCISNKLVLTTTAGCDRLNHLWIDQTCPSSRQRHNPEKCLAATNKTVEFYVFKKERKKSQNSTFPTLFLLFKNIFCLYIMV